MKGRRVVKLDPVVRELLKVQDLLQHEELKVFRVFTLQADTNWLHPFTDPRKALAGKFVAEGDNVKIPHERFDIGKLIRTLCMAGASSKQQRSRNNCEKRTSNPL